MFFGDGDIIRIKSLDAAQEMFFCPLRRHIRIFDSQPLYLRGAQQMIQCLKVGINRGVFPIAFFVWRAGVNFAGRDRHDASRARRFKLASERKIVRAREIDAEHELVVEMFFKLLPAKIPRDEQRFAERGKAFDGDFRRFAFHRVGV